MLHAFLDTNIFLSLYAYTDDNIEELRKIVQLIKTKKLKLYVSTTLNQEFWRNRDKKVSESFGNLKNFPTSLSIPRFMEHLQEAAEVRTLLSALSAKKNALISGVNEEVSQRTLAADKLFSEIREASGMIVADPFEDAAIKRMKRGNPPGKDGSVGDRINWEILLNKVPQGQDIHVVSRDKDFSSPLGAEIPNSYLGEEWNRTKCGTIFVYSGIKPFLKRHFSDIVLEPELDKALAIRSLVESKSFSQTHSAIANLAPFIPSLTHDDALALFDALIDNPEINLISEDKDVQDFFTTLILDHYESMEKELFYDVTEYIKDPFPF